MPSFALQIFVPVEAKCDRVSKVVISLFFPGNPNMHLRSHPGQVSVTWFSFSAPKSSTWWDMLLALMILKIMLCMVAVATPHHVFIICLTQCTWALYTWCNSVTWYGVTLWRTSIPWISGQLSLQIVTKVTEQTNRSSRFHQLYCYVCAWVGIIFALWVFLCFMNALVRLCET